MPITVATWNVNGIRAREAQFLEWVRNDRPDVICLQEIKASPDKLSETVCNLEGYWCYWHGTGGYSGVGLHLRRDPFPEAPRFTHPVLRPRDPDRHGRSRATSSRLGLRAQRGQGLRSQAAVPGCPADYAAGLQAEGRPLVLCGDLNVALTDRDVHPKESKPEIIGQRTEERDLLPG